jgi:hypothetical protein
MIIFYNRENGAIVSYIDGRVHDEKQLNILINNGMDLGKYIIGWIQKGSEKIECNMDKFELLQKFEDKTPESPLDYKIDISGNLISK